jgi:arylsulfatase A-like enzyme
MLCGGDAQPAALAGALEPGCATGFNVLLITLDTTRPDHLGCYGYKQAQTPTIDALCRNGVLFEEAVTSVPITLPSHATILTGRSPQAIGVRDNGSYRLAPEHLTLPEILKQHGYDTAAFVSCFVLDARFGLDQGFDLYDFRVCDDGRKAPNELRHERRAEHVTDVAIDWLQQRKRAGPQNPFFAWVHYFDPHHPYESPLMQHGRFVGNPYDAEIAYVDQHLGRLVDTLDELELRERTLIVLASDHGESLKEHQEAYHGIFIYESTIRVALLFSCPQLFDGPHRVGDRLVGLLDILPTLEDLLGLPRSAGIEGESLVSTATSSDRAIYIESYHPAEALGCAPLYGLRRLGEKFILAPTPEYYDLRRDPDELTNRYDASSSNQAALRGQLSRIMSRWAQDGMAHAGARSLTSKERTRLESLGYVGEIDAFDSYRQADPKDRISLINQMTEVSRLAALGRTREALVLAHEVARQCEGFEYAIHQLAYLYAKLNRPNEAVAVLEEYARRHPSTDIFAHLASRLKGLKRYDDFERALQAAESLDLDGRGAIPMMRGDFFFENGRYQEAVLQYQKAIEMDAQRLGPRVQQKLKQAKARLQQP